MDELIKKALKSVNLPEGLHSFIKVEKESEIPSKIAELKKLYPDQKSFNSIEDVLADETLKPLVTSYKDKEVTSGIKTFVKNKGGDPDKNEFEIIEGELKIKKTEPVKKTETEINLSDDPVIKELQETISKLNETISNDKKSEQRNIINDKVKTAFINKKLPEVLIDSVKIEDNASDEQINQAVDDFAQKLNDANITTLNEPHQGAGIGSSSELKTSMDSWVEKKQKK